MKVRRRGREGQHPVREQGAEGKGGKRFGSLGSVRGVDPYRGTLPIRNTPVLGSYSRTIPRALSGCNAVTRERDP